MAGSTVTYNGVHFENILTANVTQEAVLDESHTDLMYHRCRGTFVGIITAESLARQFITPGLSLTAPSTHTRLQELLLAKRRPFEYRINGETVLTAGPPGSGLQLDVCNGPLPGPFEIVRVYGGKVIEVKWSIEACIVLCDAGRVTGGTVLNNRWSTQDDYDGDQFCTRTVSGRLRIAGDGGQTNPHSLRGLVIPALERNFRWESGNFTATADGLELVYSLTHRQVSHACPAPATTWEGTHGEGTNDGYTPISHINLRFKGPPEVSKSDLIVLAAKVADAKVRWSQVKNDALIENVNILDHLHDNVVELSITIRRIDSLSSIGGVLAEELGKPLKLPGYDPSVSVSFPGDGNFPHLASLFVAQLQEPCNGYHGYPTAGHSTAYKTTKRGKGEKGPKIEATTTETLDPDSQNYAPEHFTAFYNHYSVGSRYEVNQHKTQCPVAASPIAAAGRAPTCAIIPLALPTGRRIVTIEAERIGQQPRFPKPADYDDEAGGRATLVDHEITPVPPRLGPDGKQRIYSIRGVFVYALERAPTAEDQLRAGAFPYDKLALAETMLPPTVYADTSDSTKAII